jgi:hypothetical protein
MRSNAASVNMARFPELSENDLARLLESSPPTNHDILLNLVQ